MQKMLYIMGNEWNWIFQRPQVLALELEKEYELTVVCTKQPVHAKYQKNQLPRRLVKLYQIPYQEKNRLVGAVAWHIHTKALGDLSQYDLIWVGYPLFGRYIPENYNGVVIYDCMDNFRAMYPDRNFRNLERACAEERKLLMRADIVFASSLKLREMLLSMCPDKEITVVRNGYSNISLVKPKQPCIKEQYTLGYIGTIAKWFDSKKIIRSLKDNARIRYELTGPVESHQKIQDERVQYRGVVEHGELSQYVEKLDCLIMPFEISDIILYVDPVKLYEYIAWGKCIIAAWYPEIERFRDFVYFYHDEEEYVRTVAKLTEEGFPCKFTQSGQEEFLKENSWDARVKMIREYLRAY